MKRFILYIVTLFGILQYAEAQSNIAFHGKAANAEGRKVELYKTSDQISQRQVLLDSMRIGEDQRIELRCFASYPMMVTMQIENYSQSFYVEPGREYNFEIPTFNWNIDEERNVFLDPVTLPLVFQKIPADDINILIDSIDRTIERFVADNYFYFDQRFKPSVHYYDSLVSYVERRCPDVEMEFVNRYKRYQLASMGYALKFKTRKSLVEQFIKNQPILYYDENYMSLFATLYGNSISKGTRDISVYRLAHWVYNLDVDTYLDSIGMDPLLRNEQVRELAALQALQESYYNFRYYDAEMVVKMIARIAQRTKFPDHRRIAQSIIDGLDKAREEQKEVVFTLPDVDKHPVALSDLKGKWVYLAFVRVGEAASQAEIEAMAHFKDTVYAANDNVAFVTIDCDREFQKMFHFLKNSRHGDRYDWTWLHFGGNFDLLRHYEVYTYPWFVLLDPSGKPFYDITPAPSTGFLLNAPWINREQNGIQRREMFRFSE